MRRSLLIVDDEPLIVENLAHMIPWEEIDCYVAASAENGLVGKQQLDAVRPDILITDIVMPGLSGMELAAYCAQKYPKCKIILLSAHADFTYAQKALTYGVTQYVLKPIDIEKLMDAVRQAKDELDTAQQEAAKVDELQEMAQNAQSLASSSLLFDIARYGQNIVEQEKSLLMQLGDFRPSVVVAVRFYNTSRESNNTLSLAKTHYTKVFDAAGHEITRGSSDEEIVFLCALHKEIDHQTARSRIVDLLRSIRDTLPKSLGIAVAAISDYYTDFNGLHHAYAQCTERLQRGFFCSTSTVLSTTQQHTSPEEPYDTTDLLHHMRHGNAAALQQALSFWRTYLLQHTMQAPVVYALREMYRCATLQASQAGMAEKPVMGHPYANENFDTMFQNLCHYVDEICTHMQKSQNLVGRLQIFIEENYADSALNLTMLADALSANSSYLSRLFKKEYGENFSDYLLRVRVDTAQYLLRTTKLKNHEIAHQVGFEDDHYFSQVFKKKCGLTPKQYREEHTQAQP